MAKLTATQPGAVSASEVQSVIDSYQPMAGLLDLASGLLQTAGLTPPKAPALGGCA